MIPLLPRHQPTDPVAYQGGLPIAARQLAADAHRLAARLPENGQMLNACTDRYWFLVGLTAAMLRGHLSVLPHNHVPDTLTLLKQEFADLYCLGGPALSLTDAPAIHLDQQHAEVDDSEFSNPATLVFDESQPCACLFTSGSTGQPIAYRRTWGVVTDSAVSAADRLGLLGTDGQDKRAANVLATVPAQHSYGFESSVFLPLVCGGALCAERPFYPADIARHLSQLPRPSVLVTTPVHLRALLGARVQLPPTDMIMSATSLLPRELAAEAEQRFEAPLQEIYGATESGQTASREPVREELWTPLPGVTISQADGQAIASGGHTGASVRLSDYLDIQSDGRFRLIGRTADMVNVAGKRSSIVHLTSQLLSIEGVSDGVFLLADSQDDLIRLAAFFVSDSLSRAEVLDQLKPLIEPAFLPRPLIQLESVPRDGTGKATRQRLLDLLAVHGGAHRSEQT